MSNFGCGRCFGEDAEVAWAASRAVQLGPLLEESHFSLRLTACACGQRFLTVFTERIDWSGGEDEQTWLAVPVTPSEAEQLERAPEDQRPGVVHALGPGRRFLERRFPTGGALSASWRSGAFGIGSHD